jgi:hypothetical protein
MIEINDGTLLHLFRNFMRASKIHSKQGSYNAADPTYFESIKAWFEFPILDPIGGADGRFLYRVHFHDVTWGITIQVTDDKGDDVFEAYYDSSDRKWVRFDNATAVSTRSFLMSCLCEGTAFNKKPVEPDYDVEAAERAAGWDATP